MYETSKSALYSPGNQDLAPTARMRVYPSAAMSAGSCRRLVHGRRTRRPTSTACRRGLVAERSATPPTMQSGRVRLQRVTWIYGLAAVLLFCGAAGYDPAGNGPPLRVTPTFFANATGSCLSERTAVTRMSTQCGAFGDGVLRHSRSEDVQLDRSVCPA